MDVYVFPNVSVELFSQPLHTTETPPTSPVQTEQSSKPERIQGGFTFYGCKEGKYGGPQGSITATLAIGNDLICLPIQPHLWTTSVSYLGVALYNEAC